MASKLPNTIRSEVIVANREGREVQLTDEQLAELGHHKRPLLKVIREYCVRCMGGNVAEVRRCTSVACELYVYRLARDPFRKQGGSGRPFAAERQNGQFQDERGEEGDGDGSGYVRPSHRPRTARKLP
jgi:hypothetical protein